MLATTPSSTSTQSRLHEASRRRLTSAIVAGLIVSAGSTASADQILEHHDDSLTTLLITSKTPVQDTLPQVDMRGVNIDGSLRAGSVFGWALNGNPFEPTAFGNGVLQGVRLHTGTYNASAVDLTRPATVPWVIGRDYNAQQEHSSSHLDSDGYQGRNWFQLSQPEIVFYDDATTAADDMVYIVYGAGRFIEFKRHDAASDEFKGKNGAAGAVQYEAGTGGDPDTYTYYDQHGNQTVFFADNTASNKADWQLWKIVNPNGDAAYVGHETNPQTAVTNGYDSSGRITDAYDSAGRHYDYTYTSVNGTTRLTNVTVTLSATTEGSVDYSYYATADNYGGHGDLKLVTVTTPTSQSGEDIVRKTYFRYWEGAFHDTTNPGHDYALQYIIGPEGYRQADYADSNFNDTPLGMTESALKKYASAYFEYDSSRRIDRAWFSGACGCSGASNGEHTFTYGEHANFDVDHATSGYDTEWHNRAVVSRPDGSYLTQYFDETGQPLSKVISDADPAGTRNDWSHNMVRDSDGFCLRVTTPELISTYDHSTGEFTLNLAGLRTAYDRYTAGNLKHFIVDTKRDYVTDSGIASTTELEGKSLTVGDVTVVRPMVKATWVYTVKGSTAGRTGVTTPTGAIETTYLNTMYTGDAALTPKTIEVTHPAVDDLKNGSDSVTYSYRYLRKDGTVAFTRSPSDIFTYTRFDEGRLVESIRDVKTNGTFASGDDPNTDWGITESGDGLDLTTTITPMDPGGVAEVKRPGHATGERSVTYMTVLADGRPVRVSYPLVQDISSTDHFHGPASYSVSNLAGGSEFSGTIEFSGGSTTTSIATQIDESGSDPITAVNTGTLSRVATTVFDEAGGQAEEQRSYFLVPGSGSGSDGTNYDPTTFVYDDSGRRIRTLDPTGTVQRTDFDAIGRVSARAIGTNDNGETGGSSSGTNNMVDVSSTQYDGGTAEKNSYPTMVTAYVQSGATDKRDTESLFDKWGRRIVTINPDAPHTVTKYDWAGRVVAVGVYTSDTGLDATDDPTSLATNRVALTETFYDEMGRVWRTERHKVDDTDGSLDDSLVTQHWYDDDGRLIKTEGSQLSKTFYDRLGRATHRFTLASDNDSGYSDADDVTGDIVLEESQTHYEDETGNVLMTVTISRDYDDKGGGETTGALDSNADGDDLLLTAANVSGRVSITAMWYDDMDRLEDTVVYGTYGGSNFDRDGLSVPARSDTALRTTRVYNDDGSLRSVTDPMAIETRYEYDDAGRQTKVIRNYVDGTPGGGTNDDEDQTIVYTYTDGLRATIKADTSGTDQTTTYTYGVASGTDGSLITSNRLLYTVQYPDSSGGTDVVTYGYNAQGQRVYMEDQHGTTIETELDDMGRTEHVRATALGTGINAGGVRRITTAYDTQGRVSTVTQYDNHLTGSGSVVDQVKYTYDDWGNVSKFEQDVDSVVSGTGIGTKDVDYTWEKNTDGRQTLRLASMDLPDGTTITYEYLSSSDLHDDEVSRVSRVKQSTTVLASYEYNGARHVVGTTLEEPNVFSRLYTSGSALDNLDRFGRITTNNWTKDLSTDVDIYDVDISFDRNSNITQVADTVLTGWTVDYSYDDLNRLIDAERGDGTYTYHQEGWTLDQLGNWDVWQADYNGDTDYTDSGEFNDDRTHNAANELTARDIDDDSSDDYTLTYDAAGQLTDDGDAYKYEYDAFGRLVEVHRKSDDTLIANYTYNGLGHRIQWFYDTDTDGDVDGNDESYSFVYDTSWRIVATYRESDSDPKEQFVYHNAGLDGRGGSSYIDAVVLRDRDANTAWTAASDGTLEERVYYLQNWRADVIALIDGSADGHVLEIVRYDPYGESFCISPADLTTTGSSSGNKGYGVPDGTVNLSDNSYWSTAYGASGADADVTKSSTSAGTSGYGYPDGTINSDDSSYWSSAWAADFSKTWGRDVLSQLGNRKGYAGYESDGELDSTYHVRHRVYYTDLGRWTRRDPIGYRAGPNLYSYIGARVVIANDPQGLLPRIIFIGGEDPTACREGDSVQQFVAFMALGGGTGSCASGPDPDNGGDDGGGEEPEEPECRIELRCRAANVPRVLVPRPGQDWQFTEHHCYLVRVCGEEQTVCSSGPKSANPSGWVRPDCGTYTPRLRAFCGPLDESIDRETGHPVGIAPVDVAPQHVDSTWACIEGVMESIDKCCKPYSYPSPNSNTSVVAALSACAPDGVDFSRPPSIELDPSTQDTLRIPKHSGWNLGAADRLLNDCVHDQ